MPKVKKIVVTYYNTNNLPNEAELQKRKLECNNIAERVLFLFEIKKQMTPWQAFRQYKLMWSEDIQKISIAARIRGLCDRGILYKTIKQVKEEKGSLNFIYKLKPENGIIDDESERIDKIVQPIHYSIDGTIDIEKVRTEFETKLQNTIKHNNNVR